LKWIQKNNRKLVTFSRLSYTRAISKWLGRRRFSFYLADKKSAKVAVKACHDRFSSHKLVADLTRSFSAN
jgi:hypothetical protein